MKFFLVMKTPDAAYAAIEDLRDVSLVSLKDKETAEQMLASILEHGEYLTVQCDTKDKSFRILDEKHWN